MQRPKAYNSIKYLKSCKLIGIMKMKSHRKEKLEIKLELEEVD